jgi:D-arabinono-1,4-lactone oxidase
MDIIFVDGVNYQLPESIADVQSLVKQAREQGTVIRVRGSYHSIPPAVNSTDTASSATPTGISIMLSKMASVQINTDDATVTVEAGCHLGFDPFDPTGISTLKNSLFYQLDQAGFAIPDMGGIIHQTVGGFLSTGSAGGSTQYSFDQQLTSIRFIPGTDDLTPVELSISDDPNDAFLAAGVSMGLYGIIVSATFNLVKRFNIKGIQSTSTVQKCKVDLLGTGEDGRPDLQEFLTTTPYARLLWYPQPAVQKVVVWQAAPMKPDDPYKYKPYQELPEILGSYLPAELAADLVYTLIGTWPNWLNDAVAEYPLLYDGIKAIVDTYFYSDILPAVLTVFAPVDPVDAKGNPQPQTFEDSWYGGLPMDNNMSDKLFPVEFTELWIPIDQTQAAMTAMNEAFTAFYGNNPGPSGAFCTELYAAPESQFWMSPAYGQDVVRIDIFWFGNNIGSPTDAFYPFFWDKLKNLNFRCHWAKYMPDGSSPDWKGYSQQLYPKWDAFMQLREAYDPQQIFVNDYWRAQLGIPPAATTSL